MTDPRRRITVGLPVYNDPDGLRCSVPTVMEQSWQGDLRLLIVDDGSTDDTPEVIHDLQRCYPAIELVTHAENLGRPAARNRILAEAGDDYLAWIDSDDQWMPRKLELQMDALRDVDPHGEQAVLCTTPFRWVYSDRGQVQLKVPDTTGDQLRNALVGSLHPYLWALLGRAEVFRQAGGFDDRLPRRQDFEFVVRFLASGGRIIRTPEDVPLATYMKTDVGRSPEEIAAANDIIRRKHAATYRRYGRGFSLEGRRKQHLLVARFHTHNRQPLRSAVRRVRARALDPVLWASEPLRIPQRFASTLRQLARRAKRLLHRVLGAGRSRAATPKRRLLDVARVARRRVGVARGRWRDGRYREALGHLLRPRDPIASAMRTARHLTREQAVDRAVARLDQLLGEPPGLEGERDVWLALEESYRLEGRYWSAEQALLAGLDRCPGDRRLLTRRIELLSLRRQWRSCVDAWESLDDHRHEVYAITHTRVARAYHQLGDHERALAVAEAGTARWPHDARLQEESRTIRAFCVDWSSCTEIVGPAPARAIGSVTSLGFLSGDEGPITGQVVDDSRQPREVEFVVNGMTIARTTTRWAAATPRTTACRSFALACDDLRRFLGDDDLLELVCEGQPLAIEDGSAVRIVSGTPSSTDELGERLADGEHFTKFGRLRPGNSPQRKRLTLDLFDEVGRLLHRELGVVCTPFYGNLLGTIREHDFLEHDIGGFDMGYLSPSSGPDAVRKEFLDACRVLLDAGFHLTVEPYSAMIRRRPNDDVFVDLNFAWVSEQGDLGLSYGWRHTPVTELERYRAPRQAALVDRLVTVPGNAEAILEQIYGPGWLVPDQGFQLELGLQRDERYLLTPHSIEQLRARFSDQVRLPEEALPED